VSAHKDTANDLVFFGGKQLRIVRTHSQPAGHVAIPDCAHTPEERGPNADSAKNAAQRVFEFMRRRDKEGEDGRQCVSG